MKTPESQAAYARRQHIGELPFAVIKTMFDMRRFLLRGQEGVSQECREVVALMSSALAPGENVAANE